MKLIIGLGNPGEKYRGNRHNVGHQFVERAKKGFKTDVFMNDSGRFVAAKLNFLKLKPADLYVVHDDLDIRLGEYKIQMGIGPKVHNGVSSIEAALGTKDFWRIRIGVDNRDPDNRTPGEDYVLQNFSSDEKKIIEEVFDAILKDDSFPS